jgi:hypothetical protein
VCISSGESERDPTVGLYFFVDPCNKADGAHAAEVDLAHAYEPVADD